ncbi:hypothetical protein PR202_gb29635 [Eleusine coracana subsp. coracana]|uniref:Alpha-soluble NSF attachment protein n=1 Tax=Eleusine coracana subsp. coracana TaxID=191504 RepID=A0AAV5G247_ELECO|nr:hypothetical protein PR202_gb29635 [Eleusine coracana subsp. coracana]
MERRRWRVELELWLASVVAEEKRRERENREYQEATELFEEIVRKSCNNNLLKYSVRGILLNAGICQLCRGDPVAINNSLERYQDLAASMDEGDVSKFTDAIKEFDSMTRLDPWKTTLLLKAKNELKKRDDDEDDLT